MFTNEDIQQLRIIIREETSIAAKKQEASIQDLHVSIGETNAMVREQGASIRDLQTSIQETNAVVKEQGISIQETNTVIKKQGKTIVGMKKDISYIKKTINIMINAFDRDDIRLRNRVDRIEKHFNLPPLA